MSEDLTTFTESGAGAPAFTIDAGSVGVSGFNTGLDVKLWRDYGADHFGDFVHQRTLNASAVANAFVVWAVANTAGNRTELVAAQNFLWVEVNTSGAGFSLTLRSWVGSSLTDTSAELALGTDYYLTVERAGTSLTLTIRTGSHTGTVVETLSLTIDGSFAFRYLIAASSRGSSSGTVSLTLGAPDINEAAGDPAYPAPGGFANHPAQRGTGAPRPRAFTSMSDPVPSQRGTGEPPDYAGRGT